jgi:hypothetical protein
MAAQVNSVSRQPQLVAAEDMCQLDATMRITIPVHPCPSGFIFRGCEYRTGLLRTCGAGGYEGEQKQREKPKLRHGWMPLGENWNPERNVTWNLLKGNS